MPPFTDQTLYQDETWKAITMRAGRLIGAEFERCVFRRCRLEESQFAGCQFHECQFVDCDLSRVQVKGCRFHSVRFEGCKVAGVNWSDALLSPLATPALHFERCVVSYASFQALTLKGLVLRGCTAQETDFAGADLTEADLEGSDLVRARFHGTTLTGANLVGARGYQIDPTTNRVKGMRVALPEAVVLLEALGVVVEEAR